MIYQSKRARDRPLYAVSVLGIFGVIYLAVLIAPYSDGGLIGVLQHLGEISFKPIWTEGTPKVILVCLVVYAFAILIAWSSKKRYHRSGVEHGAGQWGDVGKLRKEFHSAAQQKIIYTQRFAISFEGKDLYRHKRNFNTLIVGGPGSGKTRGYVNPNVLEATSNYVILDPKGEICRNTATYLQNKGYKVRVLDLLHPKNSWGYNPFAYIHGDDDVQRLVTAIFKATTPPNSQTTDPFWDEAGKMLLSALMYLVYYFGTEEEKNFPYLMTLIRAGKIEDPEDSSAKSPLELLFESIAVKYPEHICVRYFENSQSGAGKTLQSVQITLLSRLQKFELDSLAGMMIEDELELDKMGDEPTVLYCVIPDNDTSYNFIISLLYIQLFQVLYDKADNQYKGRLPRLVHVIMDEFANGVTRF